MTYEDAIARALDWAEGRLSHNDADAHGRA